MSTKFQTERLEAALAGRPIPMTRTEARRFRKMVLSFIHTDIQAARIAAMQEADTVLAKIDRIEAFATTNGFNPSGNWLAIGAQHGNHHEEVGEGKWLTVSWYRFESGRYEVTAYVN